MESIDAVIALAVVRMAPLDRRRRLGWDRRMWWYSFEGGTAGLRLFGDISNWKLRGEECWTGTSAHEQQTLNIDVEI